MNAALDRAGRFALLVLSGLATLSLMAGIASVTSRGPVPEPVPMAPADREQVPPPDPRQASFAGVEQTPIGKVTPEVAQAIAQRESAAADREVARWLQALTYAALALAGFAAAGVLVLLRITATLARIADR